MIRAAELPAALLLVSVSACVPALKEPPALPGENQRLAVSEAEAMAQEARVLFATRQGDAVRRAERLLHESAGSLPEPRQALLDLIRVRVWLVEHEPDPNVRESLATSAVHAGQWCLERAPDDPACLYRLAIAVGVQARERPGTGLDAMPTMIELLERARLGDPLQDHGGPDRVLALVYLRAPGWPGGPGDPDLGYEHAAAAVTLDPGHPPNQLALGEGLAAVDRLEEAGEAYRAALRLAEEQQKGGSRDGEEWARQAAAALDKL